MAEMPFLPDFLTSHKTFRKKERAGFFLPFFVCIMKDLNVYCVLEA